MPEDEKRLDANSCEARAEECRLLADEAEQPNHRIMLLHMADVWERIAKTCGNDR